MKYNVRQRKGDPSDPENWSSTTAIGEEPEAEPEVVEDDPADDVKEQL